LQPVSIDRNAATPSSSPEQLLRTLKNALDSLIPRGKTDGKCSSCNKGLPALDRKVRCDVQAATLRLRPGTAESLRAQRPW